MTPLLIILPACFAVLGFLAGVHSERSILQPAIDLYRARNERLISGLRGVLTGLPGFTLRGVLDKYYADMRDETEAK